MHFNIDTKISLHYFVVFFHDMNLVEYTRQYFIQRDYFIDKFSKGLEC